MPLESIINRLIPQGAVMAGGTPNLITEQGEMIPGGQTDRLSRMARAMKAMEMQQKVKEQERVKKENDRLDMYKTLRDSGYNPKAAYEAVVKGEMPGEAGGETPEEVKASAEGEKTRAETEKIKAETEDVKKNSPDLQKQITAKVAKGIKLTPGEQKVYDDVIKKYGRKSDLSSILNGENEEEESLDKEKFVPMVDPQGKAKRVHPDDVAKALKKGWKKR